MTQKKTGFPPLHTLSHYKATVARGLEELLADELRQLGARKVTPKNGIVEFAGNRQVLYRANLHVRTAMRIVMPLYSFRARDEKEYYRNVYEYPWESLFGLSDTFAIDAAVHSRVFRHSMYMARLAKDGIVDRFRDREGQRPSVDPRSPDFRLHIHIQDQTCTISLDSSGEALHRRGYRKSEVEAPLKETLAAALVLFTGWNGHGVFVDPMCGSGTIPVEAAWIAMNRAPGILRPHFGFMNWNDYDAGVFERLREEARAAERPIAGEIHASDLSNRSLKAAHYNAGLAGVDELIHWRQADFFESEAPAHAPEIESEIDHEQEAQSSPATLLVNPPYDERLELADTDEFYEALGDTLKQRYAGYQAWVFTGALKSLRRIGLKPDRKIPLFNGALESHLCRYEMFASNKENRSRKNHHE